MGVPEVVFSLLLTTHTGTLCWIASPLILAPTPPPASFGHFEMPIGFQCAGIPIESCRTKPQNPTIQIPCNRAVLMLYRFVHTSLPSDCTPPLLPRCPLFLLAIRGEMMGVGPTDGRGAMAPARSARSNREVRAQRLVVITAHCHTQKI